MCGHLHQFAALYHAKLLIYAGVEHDAKSPWLPALKICFILTGAPTESEHIQPHQSCPTLSSWL